MSGSPSNHDFLQLAARIVSAHVAHNAVPPESLPKVIRSVYDMLTRLADEASSPETPKPAVPIEKSVFPDYIICLEDGKRLTMLKRHLSVSYGMTPEAYRKRWGLPRDYPMVAPKYAARRSILAKNTGFGGRPAEPASPSGPIIQRVPEGRRGKKVPRQMTA